jgi:YidC/Oxa1 family membrane protein insertase
MDNRRLLLLLIFSFSLVMLWDAWQKYNQPKAVASTTVSTAETPDTTAYGQACTHRFRWHP